MINFDYLFDDKKDDYKEIVKEMREGKAQLIDIRELAEWNHSRFKCAIHVPLSDLVKGVGIDTLRDIKQKNKKLYLHCRSGSRVRIAQQVLGSFGCSDFNIIPMSMMQMIEQGFTIE